MCILERDLEIPMYLLLGILHIFAKVSQAALGEVIPQIAQCKQYLHEKHDHCQSHGILLGPSLTSGFIIFYFGSFHNVLEPLFIRQLGFHLITPNLIIVYVIKTLNNIWNQLKTFNNSCNRLFICENICTSLIKGRFVMYQ